MRGQFLNRPLLLALVGFVGGLCLTFGPWMALMAIALAAWMKQLRAAAFIGLSLCAGYLLRPPPPGGWIETVRFSGLADVVSVPDRFEGGSSCTVLANGVRYRLVAAKGPEFTLGDRLRVQGTLGPLGEASGYSNGAQGAIRQANIATFRRGPAWWHWGFTVANSFRDSVEGGLSPRSAALVRGVCFNQTDGLGLDDWEAFRRFGVIHLLSASGFHVVVVAGALVWLASLIPIPRSVQLLLVLAALALFAITAGFKPPIIRSVAMSAVALTAYLFRREADGLTAVSFAGLGTLLWNPAAVAELGFHLSMASTLGLVMVVDRHRWRVWSPWARSTVPTLVASGAVFPLTGFVFGEVSILGLIGNIVAAPLVAALLIVSLVAWITGVAVPPLGGILWKAVDPFAGLISGLIEVGGTLPGGSIGVPAYSVIGLGCLYGLLVLLWGKYAVD